jgi:hypothetical protein
MSNQTENCRYCQKSYRSLIQHYRKSYCGQVHHSQSLNIDTVKQHAGSKRCIDEYEDDDVFGGNYDHQDNVSFSDEQEAQICADLPKVYYPEGTIFHPPEAIGTSFTYTNQTKGYVQILQFLDKHNAPKYAFDELMEILRVMSVQNFDFRSVHPRRKTLMGKLRKQFIPPNVERIPVKMERDIGDPDVSLRCTPDTVHVYRFNIEEQIRQLLAEDLFNDVNNLVVNEGNPFGKYVPPHNRYDEINSGDWYRRTYEERIKDPDNETLLCLKIYVDKTGCDPMLQRHGLEPVMFTITIIKRGVQQDCKKAWRHIGFIPDLDQRPKSESAYSSSNDARRGRATRNYHHCWKTLLQPLYELQKTGLKVYLRIGDHIKNVHAYIPVAMIIGDAKSNDTLTCRVPHYEQPRMSRGCYTSFADCCKHDHKCVWVKQKEQHPLSTYSGNTQSVSDRVFHAKLKKVSTVRCESSLFEMDFGSNPHGQFRACTVDPMHLFEGGWCANVAKAFVRPLGSRARLELDLLLQRVRETSRSSVRERFPRINFSGGVTSMTQIASHEWPGVILAYLIALQMPQGRKLLNSRLEDNDARYNEKVTRATKKAKVDKKREKVLKKHNLLSTKDRIAIQRRERNKGKQEDTYDSDESSSSSDEDSCTDCEDEFVIISPTDDQEEGTSDNQTRCTLENIIHLFEMILCFHSFYKNSSYWKIGDQKSYERFDAAIRILMKQLVGTLNRGEKTNNWNTQKTHEILHFAEQVCEYGHLMNADTGVGERGLKEWAKKASRRALKGSVDVFTDSTARQVVDTLTLRKAAEAMAISNNMFTCTRAHTRVSINVDANTQPTAGTLVGEPKYKVVGRRVDDCLERTCTWFGGNANNNTTGLHPTVIELLEEEFFWDKITSNALLVVDALYWDTPNIDYRMEPLYVHIQITDRKECSMIGALFRIPTKNTTTLSSISSQDVFPITTVEVTSCQRLSRNGVGTISHAEYSPYSNTLRMVQLWH